MVIQKQQQYGSFLVRIWGEGTPIRWRASAQNVQTGTLEMFPNIECLLAYLQRSVEKYGS